MSSSSTIFHYFKEKHLVYVPGDFTDLKHRLPGHKRLEEKLRNTSKPNSPSSSLPLKQCNGMHHQQQCSLCEKGELPKITGTSVLDTVANFQQAKKSHRENLEHQPLPDTIPHLVYRKMQMLGCKNPGMHLDNQPLASAVGYRDGKNDPTKLTKCKICRPKTTLPKKIKKDIYERPCTAKYDENAWRFIVQDNVNPIDLAICWDKIPANPKDEPKRTTHIDGSNGSAAPAVFQMVHSPKQPQELLEEEEDADNSNGNVESVFAKLEEGICDGCKTSADVIGNHTKERAKTAHVCGHKTSCNVSFNNEKNINHPCHERLKKIYDDDNEEWSRKNIEQQEVDRLRRDINRFHNEMAYRDPNEIMESNNLFFNSRLYREGHYQSAPNLNKIPCNTCYNHGESLNKPLPRERYCIACELNKMRIEEKRPKSEYKMAFKAGKPVQMNTDCARCLKPAIKMPKLREPFARKNYIIDSLAPPFNILPNQRGQEYPNHWRLASVYQHSYKPIDLRKKRLIQSIYH